MFRSAQHDITIYLIADVRTIIEQGRQQAYAAANYAAIMTFWKVGQRIVDEEQKGETRALYGSQLIPMLAEQLQQEYGTGYGRRNLAYYRQFYLIFNDIEILHTRVQNLTWSHIRLLLSVSSPKAREWYLCMANQVMWSVRELNRNISTQYFERRLAAQLHASAADLPREADQDPLEYIKKLLIFKRCCPYRALIRNTLLPRALLWANRYCAFSAFCRVEK